MNPLIYSSSWWAPTTKGSKSQMNEMGLRCWGKICVAQRVAVSSRDLTSDEAKPLHSREQWTATLSYCGVSIFFKTNRQFSDNLASTYRQAFIQIPQVPDSHWVLNPSLAKPSAGQCRTNKILCGYLYCCRRSFAVEKKNDLQVQHEGQFQCKQSFRQENENISRL